MHTHYYKQLYNELPESTHELPIHKTCIDYLMIAVCKYLHRQSPELMNDIFSLWKNHHIIRNIRLTLKIHGQCVLEWMP